jgi:hypothetical protein
MCSRYDLLNTLLFALFTSVSAAAPVQTGCTFLAGVRYDDLRMCVASPAGKKGGPIGDIMAAIHFQVDEKSSLGVKIPVMRPILFGAAFKMLQFEPEITLEYRPSGKMGEHFFLESGVGGSFHWGPDYTTKPDAKIRDNFFAAGPILSSLLAIRFPDAYDKRRYVGLKLFYAALFSKERPKGTVIGVAIEGGFDLF